jgi:HEAT repeat protein
MPKDAIQRLRETDEILSFELRMALFAMGEELVPRLIEILLDEESAWARIHAVDLLVDLQSEEAIVPMLAALADYFCSPDYREVDETFSVRVTSRLPELGRAVLEPALAFLEENEDRDGAVYGTCDVLVELGIKDPRIFDALLKAFDADAVLGAGMLADYGDPRAAECIAEALASVALGPATDWERASVKDLLSAFDQLQGELAPDLRRRLEIWLADDELGGKRPSWGSAEPGQA